MFASPRFACLSCHKVGGQGGAVGPDLTAAGACFPPEEIVEAVPLAQADGQGRFEAIAVATADGKVRQGYKPMRTRTELVLRDPATGERSKLARADIEEVARRRHPDARGLAAAMTPAQRRDLVRFLLDLGRTRQPAPPTLVARHSHAAGEFAYDRAPLHPSTGRTGSTTSTATGSTTSTRRRPSTSATQPRVPPLLPPSPASTAAREGHWGNQNEEVWIDARWNDDRPRHRSSAASFTAPAWSSQGRLRPARRSRRASRLLQSRDALL